MPGWGLCSMAREAGTGPQVYAVSTLGVVGLCPLTLHRRVCLALGGGAGGPSMPAKNYNWVTVCHPRVEILNDIEARGPRDCVACPAHADLHRGAVAHHKETLASVGRGGQETPSL